MLIQTFNRLLFAAGATGEPVFFIAREQEDGDYAILNVDVFGKGENAPVAALHPDHVKMRTQFIDDAWLDAAVARHEKMRALNGYVPPIHVYHNEDDSNDNRAKAAYGCELRRGNGGKPAEPVTIKQADGSKKKVLAARDSDPDLLYMNFRGISPATFDLIRRKELPFRSVEIHHTEVPDIGSVAVMFSTPPFFALRPLNIILDTSKKEPAFNFEPAAMAAQFHSQSKRQFFYLGVSTMKTKLVKLMSHFKAEGLVDNEKEAIVRTRLTFSADIEPPTEEDIKAAAKEVFAAEEPDKEEEDGDKMQGEEEDTDKEGDDVASQVNLEADGAVADDGTTDEGEKMQGDQPPKPEEEEQTPPAAPAEAAAEGSAEPPPAPAEGAAAPEPAPAAEPAAPAAPPAAQPAAAAQPADNGTMLKMFEGALQKALQDALAPLVQEMRGVLSQSVGTGANAVDQTAPIVAMQAKVDALEKLPETVLAKFKAQATDEADDAKPEPNAEFEKFKADMQSQFKAFTDKNADLEAVVARLTAEKEVADRRAKFSAMIDEEVEASNGRLHVSNKEELIEQALAMPAKHIYKVQDNETNELKDIVADVGRNHIVSVLREKGSQMPPPAINFRAGDPRFNGQEGEHVADPDVDKFKFSTKALRSAQAVARDWDASPELRKRTNLSRADFIASEVFAETGMQAPAKDGK